MRKWAVAEALDTIINNAADNKDWDFYWKVRHIAEETYGCKVDIKRYGLGSTFVDHLFKEDGTLN